jgi:hypothetical protein
MRDDAVLLVGVVHVVSRGERGLTRGDELLLKEWWAARTPGRGAFAVVAAVLGEFPWGREPPVRPPTGDVLARALGPITFPALRL